MKEQNVTWKNTYYGKLQMYIHKVNRTVNNLVYPSLSFKNYASLASSPPLSTYRLIIFIFEGKIYIYLMHKS